LFVTKKCYKKYNYPAVAAKYFGQNSRNLLKIVGNTCQRAMVILLPLVRVSAGL
jgi:hypothetical protein